MVVLKLLSGDVLLHFHVTSVFEEPQVHVVEERYTVTVCSPKIVALCSPRLTGHVFGSRRDDTDTLIQSMCGRQDISESHTYLN